MDDALKSLVDARDRALSDARDLSRNKRQTGVARRVCAACWHVVLPRRFDPGTIICPKCKGALKDVVL